MIVDACCLFSKSTSFIMIDQQAKIFTRCNLSSQSPRPERCTMHAFKTIHLHEFLFSIYLNHAPSKNNFTKPFHQMHPWLWSLNGLDIIHIDTYLTLGKICARLFHFIQINPFSSELFIFADVCIAILCKIVTTG